MYTSWLFTSTTESTRKQLQLSGRSGTWTRDFRISSPAPKPLGHTASSYLHRLNVGLDTSKQLLKTMKTIDFTRANNN